MGWIGSRNALLADAASFALLALVVMASRLRRKPQRDDQEEETLFADYLPLLRNRRLMVVTGALSLEDVQQLSPSLSVGNNGGIAKIFMRASV